MRYGTRSTLSGLDPDSRSWVARLGAEGPERDAAVEDLHGILLRAARFEIGRRSAAAHLRGDDQDDLAQQSADDALVAVLAKLGDYRGESRFTTWAYKFALLEGAVAVRRRAWQSREVPLEPDDWALLASSGPSPQEEVETEERLLVIQQAMARELSPRQRAVFIAVALNGIPIDVVAERLGSTRGALYKTIHDARCKLRTAAAQGRPSPVGGHGR